MKHLVISALGADKPGIVKSIAKQVFDAGGNVAESKMSVLGDEFALIMLVSGSDASIEKIGELIPVLEKDLDLVIISKATNNTGKVESRVLYFIEVIAMDNPGIVHDITEFLSKKSVNVEELSTSNYPAAHTGTIMFSMEISISVPSEINIAQLKAEFLSFCEDLNLDVTFTAH